jgi:acetolactate synthase-1/2/3 large subunit
VLGAGARSAAVELRKLVDAFDVPFVTTPQAKGLVSELHPRSLRQGGLGASMWARQYTAQGVDVCLALGTDLDDCAVGPTPYVAPDGQLFHVDLDPAVFNRNHRADAGIVSDVGAFVQVLRDVIAEEGLLHGRIRPVLRALRAGSPVEQPQFASDDRLRITPHRAIADIAAAIGEQAAFITDIGEHMLFALHYLTARGPDDFHIHLNLGSMGSGISGAIGLALGKPERPVVCICGDGGMQMAGMEVLVALRERLPIVYAVFNDARYNMVYHGYKALYGREASWDTPPVDFAQWAQALGIPGIVIQRPGELTADSLTRLRSYGGPVVLDVRIDREVRLAAGGRNEALRRMSVSDGGRP